MADMRYRLLGAAGLRVSELCLGAMVFGDRRGPWGADPHEASAMVKRFAEAGGNFIDTANHYAAGESERIVGDLIGSDRDRWVLSTKYALSSDPEDPNAGGTSRKTLRRALDASLQRLGTDYIDLYWVHIWDARWSRWRGTRTCTTRPSPPSVRCTIRVFASLGSRPRLARIAFNVTRV
jgi:aryl-alcohol dehydrogenase-like predicted oxidoreductase